jgi:hypothetical protein
MRYISLARRHRRKPRTEAHWRGDWNLGEEATKVNQRHGMHRRYVLPEGWPGVPEQGLAIIQMMTGTGTIYGTGWKPLWGISNFDVWWRRHDT